MRHPTSRAVVLAVFTAMLLNSLRLNGQEPFRSGVELVNVTATVTDYSGRFVSGLQQSDFVVYEDDQPVEITHFNAERIPVSLGIVLDTSGSMAGRKMAAARAAVRRLLIDLLGPQDDFFLYRFDHTPRLVEGWTNDRNRMSSALQRMHPEGGTALYDAVAKALPLLKSARHRKKALLVISDGVDTTSDTNLPALKQLIRESEALVYAIGIDAQTSLTTFGDNAADGTIIRQQRRRPIPLPFPIPGRRPRYPPIPGVPSGPGTPQPPRMPPPSQPSHTGVGTVDEAVNEAALRDITDDSGGRSELVRDARDLDPATARIADELSKQYYLGYPSRGYRDGNWHTIRVEVPGQSVNVRARRGYIAAS
jgi:Ca-activated chloride channel family protein